MFYYDIKMIKTYNIISMYLKPSIDHAVSLYSIKFEPDVVDDSILFLSETGEIFFDGFLLNLQKVMYFLNLFIVFMLKLLILLGVLLQILHWLK